MKSANTEVKAPEVKAVIRCTYGRDAARLASDLQDDKHDGFNCGIDVKFEALETEEMRGLMRGLNRLTD